MRRGPAWRWVRISVSSSLLSGHDEPEILHSSSCHTRYIVTRYPKVQPLRHLHSCSDCFRLEQLACFQNRQSASPPNRVLAVLILSPLNTVELGLIRPSGFERKFSFEIVEEMRLTPGPHDFAVRVSIARQSTPGGQPKMRKGIPVCFNATAEPAHCFVSAASCSLAKPTKLTRKMLTLKSRSFGQHVQACRTGYMIEDITSYHPRPGCLFASPANHSARRDHCGSPAFRRPSSYLATSSGRRYGPSTCLRLETRSAGLSCRNRATAVCASSNRPASALLAAMMRNPG